MHENSITSDRRRDWKYIFYAYVFPVTIGLVILIIGSWRAWDAELDTYWGISFFDIVLWTVGVHAVMLTVLLSLIFKLGHASNVRRLAVGSYLVPIIIGVSVVGIVPYDLNVVAKRGIGGIVLIPLFWVLVTLTCLYLGLQRDRR
jgi:hypothetical protein